MSGGEAVTAFQLVGTCIEIVRVIRDIGEAARNAQGLPAKLKRLFNALPAIEGLLQSAQHNFDREEADDVSRRAQPSLKQCKQALNDLKNILNKACPQAGDTSGKRIWKGAITVCSDRGGRVQDLLKIIQGDLTTLGQWKIYMIDDKLDRLQEAIEAFGEDERIDSYTVSGRGHVFGNRGGVNASFFHDGPNGQQVSTETFNQGVQTNYASYLITNIFKLSPSPTTTSIKRKPTQRDLEGKAARGTQHLQGWYRLGYGPNWISRTAKCYWEHLTLDSFNVYEQIYESCTKNSIGNVYYQNLRKQLPTDSVTDHNLRMVWQRLAVRTGKPDHNQMPKYFVLAILYMLHVELWDSSLAPMGDNGEHGMITLGWRERLRCWSVWIPCGCVPNCSAEWNFASGEPMVKNANSWCEVMTWRRQGFPIFKSKSKTRYEAIKKDWNES